MTSPTQTTRRSRRERGTTALEVAIITIAGLVVATIATVTLLNVSFGVASSGEGTARDAVDRVGRALELRPGVMAVRGDVDIDGDESIDLDGADRQAIVKIEFTITAIDRSKIDLTPPYSVDGIGYDPDSEAGEPSTFISVSTNGWQVAQSAWTVEILGGNGDYFLDEGERATVTVWLHPYDSVNGVYALGSGHTDPWVDMHSELLRAGGRFAVSIIVGGGTAIEFERILPIELTQRVLLD